MNEIGIINLMKISNSVVCVGVSENKLKLNNIVMCKINHNILILLLIVGLVTICSANDQDEDAQGGPAQSPYKSFFRKQVQSMVTDASQDTLRRVYQSEATHKLRGILKNPKKIKSILKGNHGQ